MQPLRDKIAQSLLKENTSRNHRKWAAYISNHDVPLKELLPILLLPGPEAMRFSWMLGGLSEIDPDRVYAVLPKLFTLQDKVTFPNFKRSLARAMHLCGIPPRLEGKAADALLQWLISPEEIISTKVHCIYALEMLADKHPDLRHEICLAIRSQMNLYTVPFRRCAEKALKRLGEEVQKNLQ